MQDRLEPQDAESPSDSGPALLVARPHIAGQIVVGLLAVGAVGTCVASFLGKPDPPVAWIALVAAVVLVPLATVLEVHQVTVYADCVEQRRLFGIRRLRFDEIRRASCRERVYVLV